MNVLNKTSQELILGLAGKTNDVVLNQRALELIEFENTEQIGENNAKVRINSKDPVVYTGSRVVKYGKLNINKELAGLKITLPLKAGDTMQMLASAFTEKYGIYLDINELEDTEVDVSKSPMEILLKVKITDKAVMTERDGFVITEEVDDSDLSNIIKRTSLNGLVYPSKDKTRIQGPIMTYPVVSEDKVVPARYIKGYLITTPTSDDWVIADALSEDTGENWSFKQAGFTLYNAKVLYNGKTASLDETYHVNRAHENVLIFEPGKECDVGGYISIHY